MGEAETRGRSFREERRKAREKADAEWEAAQRAAATSPEAMSEAAEEEIRYIAAMDAPGPFSEKAIGALRVVLAEVDRLRQENAQLYGHLTAEMSISKEAAARLEEIGKTQEEWGYRETYPNGTVFTEAECDRECAERAISRTELPAKLIRRLAGEWREVEQEAGRG